MFAAGYATIFFYSISADCEQNIMIYIRIKVFRKEYSEKEQSDKSNGEESDTEELLSYAYRSQNKIFMASMSLINCLHSRRRSITSYS